MNIARGRMPALTALAAALAASAVAAQAANWSAVPLAEWTESQTLEGSDTLKPPYGKWEETKGSVLATGLVDRWSTMLAPGDQGNAQKISVRFTVRQSPGAPLSLPGGCARWGFYWGENIPGWDFGVVLRFGDPLNFYRVQVSAQRSQLALWDSTGGFLQIIPCAVKLHAEHTLELTARGAHFQAVLDGAPVMDYWDRTLPHASGQVGLAVYRSTVRVEGFSTEKLAADMTPMPPHQPEFRFETNGTSALILYDGHEPISHFWQNRRRPGSAEEDGQFFQEGVKLKPGWRAAYYSQVGPHLIDKSWPVLLGDLPGAVQVTGGGTSISARFEMSSRWLGDHAVQALTVRYDSQRNVYRYEYQVKQTFTNPAPIDVHVYETLDPLTYNSRSPGPEVMHRWNPAGHRWWVCQAADGTWRRMPMTDFQHIGSDAKWDGGLDFLYPDPAACPAFEVVYGWPQPEQWKAGVGMCLWGYDFHHTAGAYPVMKVKAGDELRYSVTYTALPPDEARKRFNESRLIPALETNSAKFIVFDPSGGPLRTMTVQDPQATMVWEGGVLDEAVSHEGRPSIRIDGPSDAGVGMYQYIFEQNAKRWWVRGWFKTRGVRGRGLELRVKYSYQAQPQDLFYLGGLGDKDWTPFSFITTAPQSRDHTTMAFAADGPGQVWLEGVAFSALKEGEQPEVTSFPVPSGLEPNKDIVIDLAMNEQPGKAVYDESRNGHALLLTQVAWTKKEDGRGFLTFNGTNSTAYIPLKSVLGGQDPPSTDVGESYKSRFPLSRFTYEFWIRPRPPVAHGARMMVLAYARGPWAYIDALPGKEGECQLVWKTGVFKDRGLQSFELKRNIPFDQWSHVAVVHGDGHIGLYVNGQRADEGSYDPQTPGFYFFSYAAKYDIGVAWGGGSWYHGDLGPVRLTAKALTAEEVGERCRNGWPQSAVGRERD